MGGAANGHRELTTSTAPRLARYLRTTPEFWINLQRTCDLYDAVQAEGVAIDAIEPAAA